jgi:hypothetical protein
VNSILDVCFKLVNKIILLFRLLDAGKAVSKEKLRSRNAQPLAFELQGQPCDGKIRVTSSPLHSNSDTPVPGKLLAITGLWCCGLRSQLRGDHAIHTVTPIHTHTPLHTALAIHFKLKVRHTNQKYHRSTTVTSQGIFKMTQASFRMGGWFLTSNLYRN